MFMPGRFLYISPASNLALKFISGKIKLLKKMRSIEIVTPNNKGGFIIVRKLTPEDLKALISLSSDKRPNVISVDNSIAIGTDSAIIHAKFSIRYSKIVIKSNPLPRKRSIALSKKFINKRKVITKSEKMNGMIISRIRYLDNSLMVKITIIQLNFLYQIEIYLILNFFKSVNKYFKFSGFKSTYVELKLYGGCSSAG
tara:strand:- start:3 stop:596 length:594 start_codon:yes stop_codon:yes gene_type:complete